MHIEVNGRRLWFDVEGPAVVPDGRSTRERPTLLLLHGGPGTYDHSYFKPWFGVLADTMQVVYLDLRDHGRSDRGDPAAWSFEACADDVPAVCDALGIERPIVLGHSMGGFVAILTASRHPGHAGGLILLSTIARFDLDRLTEGVRAAAGDEVAALARRDYGGDEVAANEWARVFAAFGPHVPNVDVLARRIQNLDVAAVGMDLMRGLDLRDQLPRIASPTLVCVGSLDPVTSVSASREIATGLAPGVGRLEVLEGAGHFPWLDDPDAVFGVIRSFASTVTAGA